MKFTYLNSVLNSYLFWLLHFKNINAFDKIKLIEVNKMKHLTKIFVIIAIVVFIVGYYLQSTGHESSGIKLLIAAILFMICAFINRRNDRLKKRNKK